MGKRKLAAELVEGYFEALKPFVSSLEFIDYDQHGSLKANKLMDHKLLIQALIRVSRAQSHPDGIRTTRKKNTSGYIYMYLYTQASDATPNRGQMDLRTRCPLGWQLGLFKVDEDLKIRKDELMTAAAKAANYRGFEMKDPSKCADAHSWANMIYEQINTMARHFNRNRPREGRRTPRWMEEFFAMSSDQVRCPDGGDNESGEEECRAEDEEEDGDHEEEEEEGIDKLWRRRVNFCALETPPALAPDT